MNVGEMIDRVIRRSEVRREEQVGLSFCTRDSVHLLDRSHDATIV